MVNVWQQSCSAAMTLDSSLFARAWYYGLIWSTSHAGVKLAAVKAPGFGDNRKNNLQDIAALTGGQVGRCTVAPLLCSAV